MKAGGGEETCSPNLLEGGGGDEVMSTMTPGYVSTFKAPGLKDLVVGAADGCADLEDPVHELMARKPLRGRKYVVNVQSSRKGVRMLRLGGEGWHGVRLSVLL